MAENSKNELMELLTSGAPTKITTDLSNLPSVVVHISEEDDEETKTVKNNIQFTVNTVRETVSILKDLGQTTGNARFFEAITSLLNTLSNTNSQLMKISENRGVKPSETSPKTTAPVTNNYVLMSGRDALRGGMKDVTSENE